MLGRLAVVLVVASCVSSSSVRCPDGSLCPDGTACAEVGDEMLCVAPDQITRCNGADDFAECGVNQRCYDGVCLAAGCGNRRVDPDEACDDGNTVPGDGCSTDCRSDETCGNGVIDVVEREQCDDGPGGHLRTHDGCASNCTLETAGWTQIGLLAETDRPGVAYDAARDRLVMFTDSRSIGQTWEWDGVRWTLQTPRLSPVGRTQTAMAYNPVRGRVVMFGGGSFNDTWEWDGTRWELRAPATTPPPRRRHALAYDPGGKRIVMFGGVDPQTAAALGDVWAWDGDDWQPLPAGPSARSMVGLAYDPKRDVVVLVGGLIDATVRSDETWTLAGSTWSKQMPANVPPARSGHAVTWDPRSERIVMHGGSSSAGTRSDTWLWNGIDWTLHPVAGPQVANVVAATTRLAGYPTMFDQAGRTFRWDAGWTLVEDNTSSVLSRFAGAAAADVAGRRVVIHGGSESAVTASTMVWSGAWQRFNNATPGTSPGRVSNAAMTFDTARDEFVHFGGFNATTNAPTNETWVYTTSWAQRTPPAPLPAPRNDHVLAYDAARAQTVLFGGAGLDDTWLWNGTQWSAAQPATKPPSRAQPVAAYDPIREVVVMFGGLANGLALGDTWEWNGADWTRRMVPGPPPRAGAGMAWDTARQRIVLFGGFSSSQSLGDQWEWDGTTWTQVPVSTQLKGRANHIMVSGLDGGVLVFGGIGDSAQEFSELQWLRWDNDAPDEVCDAIDRDGDGAIGCDDADCWRVCTPECLPGTTCVAGAPGCGDGTCAAITESCSTCNDCTCAPTCGDLVCGAGESCPGDC